MAYTVTHTWKELLAPFYLSIDVKYLELNNSIFLGHIPAKQDQFFTPIDRTGSRRKVFDLVIMRRCSGNHIHYQLRKLAQGHCELVGILEYGRFAPTLKLLKPTSSEIISQNFRKAHGGLATTRVGNQESPQYSSSKYTISYENSQKDFPRKISRSVGPRPSCLYPLNLRW